MSKTKIVGEFREAAARLEGEEGLSPEAREAARRMARAFTELRRLAPGDRARELEARVAELEARGRADLAEARRLAEEAKEFEAQAKRIVRQVEGLYNRVVLDLRPPDAINVTRQANDSVLNRLTPLLGRGAKHDAALRLAARRLADDWAGLLLPLYDKVLLLANLLGRVVAEHGPTVVVGPWARSREGVGLGLACGEDGSWTLNADVVPVKEEADDLAQAG